MKLKQQEKLEWIGGVGLIALGLFCLFFPYKLADGLVITLSILCSASALLLLFQAWKQKNVMELLKGIIASILAAFLWGYHAEGVVFISLIFGWYMIGTGVILMLEGAMDLKEKSMTGIPFLLIGLIGFIFGVILCLYAKEDVDLLQISLGGYFIYQGLQLILELYVFQHHSGSRSWSFRYWNALPVYIVAAGPSIILRMVHRKKMDRESFPFDAYKNDKTINLRVFVHTGLSGDHQVGHMTFSYQGIMYSYGNYDVAEEKLFRTFGPGILFTVPMEIYVNNSCIYEDSVIFEFGIHLTPEQEKHLQQILADIDKETYRWYCPLSREAMTKENFEKLQKDYTCRLYWRTGSKFYKFKKGIWKTYWVLGNNCSLFTSSILHELDKNQYALPRGINTPGEFFEFFTQAYQDPKSNVVYQSWHTAELPDTLFDAAL